MLYIDPEECIDCDACAPECPVGAIFAEPDVPQAWMQYIQLNAERAQTLKATGTANITEKQEPLKGCKH
jgi:ferredoxin